MAPLNSEQLLPGRGRLASVCHMAGGAGAGAGCRAAPAERVHQRHYHTFVNIMMRTIPRMRFTIDRSNEKNVQSA